MRYFQVMRIGRRATPTTPELAQSIIQSNDSNFIRKRRSSMFVYDKEFRQNLIQSDNNNDFRNCRLLNTDKIVSRNQSMDLSTTAMTNTLNKRHTLNVEKSLTATTTDGIDLTRRPSFNNGRRLSFQIQDISESSKSKTNLRNFYVFFISLFLFIFLAVVYSFIRMIKNQVS